MELTLPLIALPAVVALILKAAVYVYTRLSSVTRNLETRLFLLFLFFLAIQNVAEIWGFHAVNISNTKPLVAGKLYFAAAIMVIVLLFHLSLHLALDEKHPIKKVLLPCIYGFAGALESLLVFTPWIVQDFGILDYRIGLTMTRIPGPMHFLFEIYTIGMFVGVIAMSLYGSKTQRSARKRAKNRVLLTASIPTVVLVVVVIGLLHFGIKWINATVTVPITIAYFLIVTAYGIYSHRFLDAKLTAGVRNELLDARRQLYDLEERVAVLGKENRLLREQNAQLTNDRLLPSEETEQAKTLDEDVAEFEARLIARALKHCEGNKAQAARVLGLRPNTLHYKIERYGLSDKKSRE